MKNCVHGEEKSMIIQQTCTGTWIARGTCNGITYEAEAETRDGAFRKALDSVFIKAAQRKLKELEAQHPEVKNG